MAQKSKKQSSNYVILKRLIISILAVVFVRLIYFIPLPGVRIEVLADFYQKHIIAQGGSFFDLMALLHFGKLRNLSILSLGIIPFIQACLLVQIIGFLVPGVNKKFFSGKETSHLMVIFTIVAAILISAFNAYFIALDIELLNNFPNFNIISFEGFLFNSTTILSVIGGIIILIIASEFINRFGLGNGVAVIFASEILLRFVFAIDQVSTFYGRNLIDLAQLMLFGFVCFIFVCFARYVTLFNCKIEFCSADEEKFFVRIRPLWVGVWPLIITEQIMSFFKISLNAFSFLTVLLACAAISFLYAKIIYQPRRFYEVLLARNCKAHKNQKKMIEDNLNQAMVYCICLSLTLFMVMYYLPIILPSGLKISFLSSSMFGAFGIIVLVGLFYDINDQIKFFKKIYNFPEMNWQFLSIAQDEVHAEVEKACLRSHGIMTEINPSHFNWGMPIRTVASGYSMYVPEKDKLRALSIIKKIKSDWHEKSI
ncbi:MAG: hypothetical protein KKD05_06935 [Candidatus Omnitrophica bacterium]|nr:hypothetical protein [Candidatus Omnitrophota bacterium]